MERNMFISAACFNWLVAIALAVNVELVFGIFHIEPVPADKLFLHFFAALVFAFGITYHLSLITGSPMISLPTNR